jgi:predicted AlkP superfamily pyrophosphatase or phosphodiesterase
MPRFLILEEECMFTLALLSVLLRMLLGPALFVFMCGSVDLYAAAPPLAADKLVLIVTDGLRPDALKQAKVPVIDGLIKRGASTMKAQTVMPSLTLPAFASLLTGLPVGEHGIDWNEYEPMRGFLKAPTVFELASFYGSKWGAFFLNKEKLLHLAKPDLRVDITTCSVSESGCDANHIATDVISYYRARARVPKPDLFVIHLADPDVAGHAKGWMSPAYLRAVEATDRAIGTIIRGFQELGLGKHTAYLITTDHGGHDHTHGTSSQEDMTIPWILAGPGIKSGYEIKRPVSIIDTPATVLRALGIFDYYVEWKSREVDEVFTNESGPNQPARGNATP